MPRPNLVLSLCAAILILSSSPALSALPESPSRSENLADTVSQVEQTLLIYHNDSLAFSLPFSRLPQSQCYAQVLDLINGFYRHLAQRNTSPSSPQPTSLRYDYYGVRGTLPIGQHFALWRRAPLVSYSYMVGSSLAARKMLIGVISQVLPPTCFR